MSYIAHSNIFLLSNATTPASIPYLQILSQSIPHQAGKDCITRKHTCKYQARLGQLCMKLSDCIHVTCEMLMYIQCKGFSDEFLFEHRVPLLSVCTASVKLPIRRTSAWVGKLSHAVTINVGG